MKRADATNPLDLISVVQDVPHIVLQCGLIHILVHIQATET